MSKHTQNNDAATLGIGVKWLHDILKQRPQQQQQQQQPCKGPQGGNNPQISNRGKMILDQLLRETKMHPTNSIYGSRHKMQNVIPHELYNECSSDDDDDDDDDDSDDGDGTLSASKSRSRLSNKQPTWKFMMHQQHPDVTNHNNDNDDENDDDLNNENDIQQFCSEERCFFLTLLTIIHELCQKQGEEKTTKSNNKVSSSSTSTSFFVSTNEIIKAFHSKESNNSNVNDKHNDDKHPPTKTKKKRRILPASRIPSTLNSNQLIFSTLVFLSQTIPELQHSTKSSNFLNHHQNMMNQSFSTVPQHYFPTMPLLSIKERNSNDDNMNNNSTNTNNDTSSTDTKNLHHSLKKIPLGYQINHETIPSMDLLQDYHFIRKLSILESCFWSTSTSRKSNNHHNHPNNTNIQQQYYIPRIHAIPRVGGTGVLLSSCSVLSTKEDEEKLLTTGTLKKSTSNTGGNRKGNSQGKKKDTIGAVEKKNSDSSKRKFDDMDTQS